MTRIEKHLLEIDSVELSFDGRSVLSDVYLPVETGCTTALLGHNGSGKSCLMKILTGALHPDFATIRIDGKWKRRLSEKDVRYLPQRSFLPGGVTPEQVLRDFGLSWDELRKRFPLFEKAKNTRIRNMSGGEQRILECFVILQSEAKFVMLDEPFSQIAPLHIETLQSLIREQTKAKGILLTDHIYRHVAAVADRLYMLSDGAARPIRQDTDLIRYGYLNRLP